MKVLRNIYFIIFSALFFVLVSCKQTKNSEKATTANKTLEFEKIEDGSQCGIQTDTLLLIRNENDLVKDWNLLKSNRSGKVTPPVIDFSKENVVIVAQGMQNKGGHFVKVLNVEETQHNILVNTEFHKPAKNCRVTDVVTFPYEVIKIPRVEKMVLLNAKSVTDSCK